jgi:hypothetical protein
MFTPSTRIPGRQDYLATMRQRVLGIGGRHAEQDFRELPA